MLSFPGTENCAFQYVSPEYHNEAQDLAAGSSRFFKPEFDLVNNSGRSLRSQGEEDPNTSWFCHCCNQANVKEARNCKTCGRPAEYGMLRTTLYMAVFLPFVRPGVVTRAKATDDPSNIACAFAFLLVP